MTVPKADRLQPWHPLEQRLNAAFCRECIDMFSWSLAEPLLLNDEEMGGRFSGGAASAGPRNMLASSAKTPGAAALESVGNTSFCVLQLFACRTANSRAKAAESAPVSPASSVHLRTRRGCSHLKA